MSFLLGIKELSANVGQTPPDIIPPAKICIGGQNPPPHEYCKADIIPPY